MTQFETDFTTENGVDKMTQVEWIANEWLDSSRVERMRLTYHTNKDGHLPTHLLYVSVWEGNINSSTNGKGFYRSGYCNVPVRSSMHTFENKKFSIL